MTISSVPSGFPPSRNRNRLYPIVRFIRRFPLGAISIAVLLAVAVVAVAAPLIAKQDPIKQDYAAILLAPSEHHAFGTDALGRDVFSRSVFGARVSLLAALIAAGIATAIGLPIGLLVGFRRTRFDELVVMRLVDGLQAFPFLILAMVVTAALGPGFGNAMVAIGIAYSPNIIRIVRGAALQVRQLDYVEAATSLGMRQVRVLLRHVLPNLVSPLLVQLTVLMASAIIAEAGLSYLGLGTQPPTPSWGSELRVAQGYVFIAPWMAIWPGVGISVTVLALNLFGDALRDFLDPRQIA